MPYPDLLHPEPLQQATADPCLHRRLSNTKRRVWLSLCGVSWCTQGFVSALPVSLVGIRFDFKCDFTPSYHLTGASHLPLDVGYIFLVGSNILLSLVIQQGIVILDAIVLVFFLSFFLFLIFSLKLALSLSSFIFIRGSLAHSACPLPLNTHTHTLLT